MAANKAVTAKKTPAISSPRATSGKLDFMNLLRKKNVKLNNNSKDSTWKVGDREGGVNVGVSKRYRWCECQDKGDHGIRPVSNMIMNYPCFEIINYKTYIYV
jgi:hypothetical protein